MSENPGRYKILEEIGQGGFAIVHRARDTQLDRLVALKELRPILLRDGEWVKRFRREARTIARLDHPNIVTIHDVSSLEERLFIVMRLINGPSLEDLLAERGRLSWPETVEIITAVARGLGHAHSQGILHRDLKPANILMDPERGPLLSDFGLSKLIGESSMSVSASGSVVGTPHYIAPELWEGQKATPQSDIYALGCILSEMLTGEKVFKGETPPTVMMAHFKPPSLPGTWPLDVPSGATNVLKTALASTPSGRYPTVDDLTKALFALSTTASDPNQTEEIAFEQQNVEPKTTPVPQSTAILQGGELDPAVEQIVPSEAVAQTPVPLRSSLENIPDNTKLNFRRLEDTIADLPPKWHSFLKNLSLAVIVIVMLAITNLFTSGYPWFIWIALVAGIVLAIRFVNLLFEDRNGSIPPSTPVEPSTATTLDNSAASVPSAGLQTPVIPLDSEGQDIATPPVPAVSTTSQPVQEAFVSSTPSTQVDQTPSQEIRAREKRKKSGCMWISVSLVGVFLILIVGIGGFCSLAGNMLQSALPTIELGPTLTENINVAIPVSAAVPNLSLRVSGGKIFLAPGAENGLIEGTITYNAPQLAPIVDVDDDKIRIYPTEAVGLGAVTTDQLENTWDMMLASTPIDLAIETEGADAEIELGSLSIADLALGHGAGEFYLSFSEPNQIDMSDLTVKGGAASIALIGLANARAEEIAFEAGAGEFMLDFSGNLQRNVDVEIKSGLSSVTIIVPDNVSAKVITGDSLSDVEMMGSWQKLGDNRYALSGEGAEINITTEIGLGTLILQTLETE